MTVITESILTDFLLSLVPLLFFLYRWCTSNNDYWDKRGVPNTKRAFFIEKLIGIKSQSDQILETYKQYCNERFWGYFILKHPVLTVQDPELIYSVLVKDFTHFEDRNQPPQTTQDPLSGNLFRCEGRTWHAMRSKLIPTFSSSKLKGMFEQISKCGDHMNEELEKIAKENVAVKSKTFFFQFTFEAIESCVLGLQSNPNSLAFSTIESATGLIKKGSCFKLLRFAFWFTFPKLASIFNVRQVPSSIGDEFFNLTKAIIKYRQDNKIQRNDYLQLLLTLKEQEENGKDMGLTVDKSEHDTVVNQLRYAEQESKTSTSNVKLFTDETICANNFNFMLSASDSTSGLITLILFELTRHPDVQEKLQQEVDSVLANHGGWSYEAVKDMTYLNQVIQESLRLYPVLPMVSRKCTKAYKVPGSDLVIDKGVFVFIPSYAIHMDPQYYPNPELFKPDRFENNDFRPSPTYLPFGDGPRICIGMRFAVMEVKTLMAKIMSQFSVKLSPQTPLPLQQDTRSFFTEVTRGIRLTFSKRKVNL